MGEELIFHIFSGNCSHPDLCHPHLSAVPRRGPGLKASGAAKAQAKEEPSRPFSPMAKLVERLNTARAAPKPLRGGMMRMMGGLEASLLWADG